MISGLNPLFHVDCCHRIGGFGESGNFGRAAEACQAGREMCIRKVWNVERYALKGMRTHENIAPLLSERLICSLYGAVLV